MKQRKCPYRGELCHDYGDCESCEWSGLITKYERKIVRLKKKAEQTRKKTAREILQVLFQYGDRDEALRRHILYIADEYGVEVKGDD